MPRVEHIAIWTRDIERLASFYAGYLGGNLGAKYVNAAKGFESRFLSFEGGSRLELMSTQTLRLLDSEPAAQRIGLTHLAFSLGTEARVDELTRNLRAAGFTIVGEPRRTGDGYYESVVLDPDGNRIELTV